MEEGTVVEWPIPIGGHVEKGQTVLVIETEKAENEIEATASGTLRHIYSEPGETLPCGALLAAITEEFDESFDGDAFAAASRPPESAVVEAAPSPSPNPSPSPHGIRLGSSGERQAVAPAARALAKKLGVDLETVSGTGPNGRITKQDVEGYASAREKLTAVEAGIALEVLRQGVGDPVVLLPGFGTDVSSYALQMPSLVSNFEVFAINPRGVGASDAPDLEVYPIARAAEDVAAVLEAPAHVVGSSLGAAVAIELALAHPDRVRSLSLITPFLELSPRLISFLDAWTRVAAEASPATVAAFLAPWLFGERLLADEKARVRTLRGLAQSVKRVPVATLERAAAGLVGWSGTRGAELREIMLPTRVLLAGEDLLTPRGKTVSSAIPHSTCKTIPGCGHALTIDGASDVTRWLLSPLSDR